MFRKTESEYTSSHGTDSKYDFVKRVLEEPEGERLLLGEWSGDKDMALANLLLTGLRKKQLLNLIPELEFEELSDERLVQVIAFTNDVEFVKIWLEKIEYPQNGYQVNNGIAELLQFSAWYNSLDIIRYILDRSRENTDLYDNEFYDLISDQIRRDVLLGLEHKLSKELLDLIMGYGEMTNIDEQTAEEMLAYAIAHKSTQLMEYALSKNVIGEQSLLDRFNRTIEDGYYDGVEVFIDAGINVNHVFEEVDPDEGVENYTLLDTAIQNSYLDIADLLLPKMLNKKLTKSYYIPMNVRVINYVMKKDLLPDQLKTRETWTDPMSGLIMKAIDENRLDILEYLVSLSPSILDSSFQFSQPMSLKMVKFLLQNEKIRNNPDNLEELLDTHIDNNRDDVVRFLILSGLILPRNKDDILSFFYSMKRTKSKSYTEVKNIPENKFVVLNEIAINHGYELLRPSSDRYLLFLKQQRKHIARFAKELSKRFGSRDIVADLMGYIYND